ncbi:tetratricopeptide repeat protein [Aquabacterium sp. A7-Y]|uniref:tetratricopeptide repeat protein n=1 Tax=Aquabacterium sp. A7-Y TaxID=1349605 RepID=UPI00223CBFC3|nr:tetratricopeptide repeat protein [Aquabacterium sp. A7-Y]MCW7540055.1 tetratricopeptide repeat protein [Aquabacterium sp. A7-Y]
MRHDERGLPVGTNSTQAREHADRALWRLLSFFGNPLPDLEAAAEADPGWLLPPVMQAGFLLSLTERGFEADARAALARAAALEAHGSERERGLLAGVRLGWQGDWAAACRCWDQVLDRAPRDALALLWGHLFDFHRGDADALLRRVERVLPDWDADDPLWPYVLGMHAFGLEENHRHAEAEVAGRRALEGGAPVPWAVHAVAHVMEMQGRHEEGRRWLMQHEPMWADGNGFAGHLWWHRGLFELEGLDTAAALQLYDNRLNPEQLQIALQRLDATALLWRLELLDVDVGPRWRQLAGDWDQSESSAGWSPFNDLHVLLALLGSGEPAAAERWLARVATRCAGLREREGEARWQAGRAGLALMQGLLAYARGDDHSALPLLQAGRIQAARIGGSHAQRDLVTQTLLASAARCGQRALGLALLAERQGAKAGTPLTRHWQERLAR